MCAIAWYVIGANNSWGIVQCVPAANDNLGIVWCVLGAKNNHHFHMPHEHHPLHVLMAGLLNGPFHKSLQQGDRVIRLQLQQDSAFEQSAPPSEIINTTFFCHDPSIPGLVD